MNSAALDNRLFGSVVEALLWPVREHLAGKSRDVLLLGVSSIELRFDIVLPDIFHDFVLPSSAQSFPSWVKAFSAASLEGFVNENSPAEFT
jgi:hypothetical protein